jgi:hypothetical protein
VERRARSLIHATQNAERSDYLLRINIVLANDAIARQETCMRKFLLANAALMVASAGLAHAQTSANPSQGQLAAPYGAGPATNNNNNAWGIANTPTGSTTAGALSTVYAPNINAVPAPGTIVIRLNGRVEVGIAANFTSADTGVAGNKGYKLDPLGVYSFARLYPAFDGLAANGLRYGAAMEIRENFAAAAYPGSPTGSSAPTTTGTAAGPSTNSSGQTLFIRRAFAYLASDQAGILRIGQGDGVIGLFDNCVFTSQCWDASVGNFNGGDAQSTSATAGIGIPFVWLAQAGAEYSNNKIVYLSPQAYGFDFGVQFAPSMGNALQDSGAGVGCVQAGPTCINTTSGNDSSRWFNQVGVGLRYQHTFGPVDVKAYGFYETAGKENLTVGSYATTIASRSVGNMHYDNLSFYKAGVAVTAYNFTAAADYIGGAVDGQLGMRPTGGAPMNAVVTGLTYAKGPITLGAEFGIIDSQGDVRLVGVSQRHEYEVAFGGAYKLAPGLQLVGEYIYEHRHQGGFDFSANGLASSLNPANTGFVTRDAQSNSYLISTILSW